MAHRTTRPSRTRTALLTTALALGIAVTGSTAAYATVAYVGGGTWDYGVTSLAPSNNWSNYHHGSRVHGSSVTGNNGLVRSACRSAGIWATATAYDSNPFRIDHAYWRHC